MDMNEYQQLAQRTSSLKDDNMKLLNGCMGLNGEAGEVIDILKKNLMQGHELNHNHILEELGDALWYIAEAASALHVDLAVVAQMNIYKLKARYPDGFDPERSINREV